MSQMIEYSATLDRDAPIRDSPQLVGKIATSSERHHATARIGVSWGRFYISWQQTLLLGHLPPLPLQWSLLIC
jgi:hypothetical protein